MGPPPEKIAVTCSMVKWFSGSLGGGATGSHVVACHCNKWWSDPGARGGEGRELAGEKRACAKTAETCTNEI